MKQSTLDASQLFIYYSTSVERLKSESNNNNSETNHSGGCVVIYTLFSNLTWLYAMGGAMVRNDLRAEIFNTVFCISNFNLSDFDLHLKKQNDPADIIEIVLPF